MYLISNKRKEIIHRGYKFVADCNIGNSIFEIISAGVQIYEDNLLKSPTNLRPPFSIRSYLCLFIKVFLVRYATNFTLLLSFLFLVLLLIKD